MRRMMKLLGIIAVIIGLVWMGQGSGVFPYPAASFMIDQSPWIAYGAIAVAVGALLLWFSRKR